MGTFPRRAVFGAAALALQLFAAQADAQITRIDLDVVESPALEGERFGTVGQYEWLRGTAYGEIDPGDPRHQDIVLLEAAPRNARGKVEYSTTVEIYRPVDMRRWNRAIYHTVPNRGGARGDEPALLERGFAMVRVGWQGDIAPTATNVVPSLPVARNADGSPVVGRSLEEFIFNDQERRSSGRLTYPAASLDPSKATLTVRRLQDSPRSTPADLRWSYVGEREISIERPAGYDGGAIYEFIYEAKDPIVMGLGFAAIRDVISFLRYETTDQSGNANPLAFPGLPNIAVSLGVSQSGRALRDFLYLGFNEDTRARIVFDGMHPDIAGSRKTFTNYAFAQPGRWQKQHEDHWYPGDQFPFTYAMLRDQVGEGVDGLLVRCSATDTCPKIVHSDGEAELWQGRSSLVVTDPSGNHITLPDDVRVYLFAGVQHGGGGGVHTTPRPGFCQNSNNPLPLRDIRTALTVALYEWVADGKEPPPSRFPTVAHGGLVAPRATGFPSIPGVTYSGSVNTLHLLSHSSIPPVAGRAYTVLVGRVDADGNMVDGIRHPNLAAPLGTYTGWNLRREGFGAGDQCAGGGSFIPFAATRAERMAKGDPRLSLEERYADHATYVRAVTDAAEALVRDRLLLRADADEIIHEAQASSVRR
jgi:hypothetical protein